MAVVPELRSAQHTTANVVAWMTGGLGMTYSKTGIKYGKP